MLFADFGDDSALQLASFAMAGSELSHPPMMPTGFLPVDVSDGSLAPANGRSAMPPRLRPRTAIHRSGAPLFGAFGLADDVAPLPGTSRVPLSPRVALAPPTPSRLKTAPAPLPMPMPSASSAIPSPVDPYAPATSSTHWGWWALAGVGAVGALAGVVLLVGGRRKRK